MLERIFVLDVSGFIFRAYFALPEMKNPSGDATQAVFGFIRSLNKLIQEFSPRYMVAVFDGPDNKRSRREIYSEYKSNREPRAEDLYQQIPLVKEYCALLGLSLLEVEGVEADDVIASVVQQAVGANYAVTICTADKDLLQLVGGNVNVVNPWKHHQKITEEDVLRMYGIPPAGIPDYLALVGDTSDNIPGVFGCGPKKAQSLLQKYPTVEDIFTNFDLLTPPMQKMLAGQQEGVRMGKDLALLDRNVPLPASIEAFLFPSHESDQDALNCFYRKQGFNSLLQYKKESVTVDVVAGYQHFASLLPSLYGKEVAFSVGYQGEFLPSLTVFGVALACDSGVYYLDLEGSEELLPLLKTLFDREDITFYGYNIKRDLHALCNMGIEPTVKYDLALAEHLTRGGAKLSFSQLLVDYDLSRFVGQIGKEWGQLSLPILKKPDLPSQYFGEFVFCLPKIKEALLNEVREKGLGDLFFNLEMPLESVLFTMERAGAYVDREYLKHLDRVFTEELSVLTRGIYEMVGEEFNIKSPKQLSHILYTKLGLTPINKARSTKAEVLESLSWQHIVVEKILSYRMIDKLLSTYVRALPKQIDPHTLRIHPTFNQTGTMTGRLACQDPNLQNIPIRSDRGRLLRKAFCVPSEGTYFLSADYSQIELRFLAHLSQDESLKLAFESREDVHTFTASQVFRVPLESVTKEQRMQAKTVNFGIIYGQQAYGLSKTLKISMSEAQGLIDAYFERYPGVAHFIHETIEHSSQHLRVTTLLGRERSIEDWSETPYSRASSGRLAVNTRIQGSAAELIKLAMLQLSDAFQRRRLKTKMLLQVHDELIFEVPEEEKEEIQTLVRDIMESAIILSVPLVVNILVGKNWAEC